MIKNNTIIIVQARMGSKRLPGKSLIKLYKNYTLIDFVLLRCLRSKLSSKVILATSVNTDCNPLVFKAKGLGCDVIRGDENDVLSRFISAIEIYNPKNIVRVCADNPFISFEEIDKLIKYFEENRLDYATNNTKNCGLPDGFGAEILKSKILNGLNLKSNKLQKEHVTQYILDNHNEFKIGYLNATKSLYYPHIKLDIDTEEDLIRFRDLCKKLVYSNPPYWSNEEIINAYNRSNNE